MRWSRALNPLTVFAGVLAVALIAGAYSKPASPVHISGRIGEYATVEGVVSEVHEARSGRVTFVDLGGRYPDNTFAAVIWEDNAGQFPDITSYEGRAVRIKGILREYDGRAEIILRSPDQIQKMP
jgi:DNA/RNA endonuclease YhcR with UshA esterase domain